MPINSTLYPSRAFQRELVIVSGSFTINPDGTIRDDSKRGRGVESITFNPGAGFPTGSYIFQLSGSGQRRVVSANANISGIGVGAQSTFTLVNNPNADGQLFLLLYQAGQNLVTNFHKVTTEAAGVDIAETSVMCALADDTVFDSAYYVFDSLGAQGAGSAVFNFRERGNTGAELDTVASTPITAADWNSAFDIVELVAPLPLGSGTHMNLARRSSITFDCIKTGALEIPPGTLAVNYSYTQGLRQSFNVPAFPTEITYQICVGN